MAQKPASQIYSSQEERGGIRIGKGMIQRPRVLEDKTHTQNMQYANIVHNVAHVREMKIWRSRGRKKNKRH